MNASNEELKAELERLREWFKNSYNVERCEFSPTDWQTLRDRALAERHALKLKLEVAKASHLQVIQLCEDYQNACIEGCEPEAIQADSDRRINLICKTSCEALSQLNESK